MLSKNNIKFINSLSLKKNRDSNHLFVAEGEKLVDELLAHIPCEMLIATDGYVAHQSVNVQNLITVPNQEELKKISFLKTPSPVIGVFQQRQNVFNAEILTNELVLALDDIQDPGNLGTITRIADWFGIQHIICSPHTVDIYNFKAVQATMGAISRVQVYYTDLVPLLINCQKKNVPIYGTFLQGDNIYSTPLTSNGLIIMGNEGQGISHHLQSFIARKLFIPNYPSNTKTSDSLNVAIATAITCSEFRRRLL